MSEFTAQTLFITTALLRSCSTLTQPLPPLEAKTQPLSVLPPCVPPPPLSVLPLDPFSSSHPPILPLPSFPFPPVHYFPFDFFFFSLRSLFLRFTFPSSQVVLLLFIFFGERVKPHGERTSPSPPPSPTSKTPLLRLSSSSIFLGLDGKNYTYGVS
ncbi:hypothetical protein RIF29_14639 [Crotalaria pallida]|uniref:Uncharacterized protein n=1 Tax=Crotalaria pallida TaxID=3830 RepID=A0AAN9FI66_CROPI